MESGGWQTSEAGADGKYFSRNGLRVYLDYTPARKTRYSIALMLDGNKSSVPHKNS